MITARLLAKLDGLGAAFILVLLAAAIAVPILALAVPRESSFFIPPYIVALVENTFATRS